MKPTLFHITDICQSHKIEVTFVRELQENGLIHITVVESQEFIDEEELLRLEKYANLYYDLELNIQGLAVVENLLRKIQDLQEEILSLKGIPRDS